MASLSYDSSDDEDDDVYCNAAARLKALKNQRKDKPKPPAQKKSVILPIKDEIITKETKIEDYILGENSTSPENQSSNDHENVEILSDSDSLCNEDEPISQISCNEPITIVDSPINIVNSPLSEEIDADNRSIEELDESINDSSIIDIHVKWKSNKIECLHLNKNEPLLKIFQHFADRESISIDRVFFYKKDIPIRTSDTPSNLKLSIIDVLEGGILNTGTTNTQNNKDEETDSNCCKIKAQLSSKKSLTFRLAKDEKFKKLKNYCSAELGVAVDKIKFYFDGDHVNDNDTPDSLDLDDEACIDIKIIE